jgi:cytochrome c peroxidase
MVIWFRRLSLASVLAGIAILAGSCRAVPRPAEADVWERDNPLRHIPPAPLGTDISLAGLKDPPTPARVRLGRWLFFDRRLSADGTLSCASCHQPEHAFSQTTAVASGIAGQQGARKVPTIVNLAIPRRWTTFVDVPPGAFFWDGRVRTLEQQAMEPIASAREMGSSRERLVSVVAGIAGYAPYFEEAFGDAGVTPARVARAIADYERTRMSGNSPFDRWQRLGRDSGVSAVAKSGFALFTGKAGCVPCHRLPLFTDGEFHNLGIGWDARTETFADEGRHVPTKGTVYEDYPGTFKTPTLREVTRHPPYMHDGSIPTLREVVQFYNRGANPNPYLSARLSGTPLGLTDDEIDAIVAFLKTLEGEGWQDSGPKYFPR